jgi:hypothetical protein
MRHSLAGVLRRARLAKQASCPGQHVRTVVSFVEADDPTPASPPSAEPCACGAAVTVSHVIYVLIHELPDGFFPQGIVISGSLGYKILDIDLGCLPAT